MGIIGYGNDDIDVSLIGGTVVTSGHGMDTALVKTAIYSNAAYLTPSHSIYFTDQKWGGAALASFRLQFLANCGDVGSFNTHTLKWLVFKNLTSGLEVFRICHVTATRNMTLQYNTSSTPGSPTWVAVGVTQTEPAGVHFHTLEVDIHDTTGVLKWYRDGILLASMTGDTKLIGVSTIEVVDFWGWSNDTGFGGGDYYWAMHLLTTVDYQPYGLQVVNPAINGAGAVAGQDSGVYTDVNETTLNRANGLTLDTAGDGFSGTVADLAGTAATAPIMAVRAAADVRCGSTGPNDVKLFVRVSGTNYYSPSIPISGIGFVTVMYIWELNPATGLPWTIAEYNAAEVGCEAA
jgi:hypothetical protein